ncbi:diguanylate cyclase domain-containing protein [Listeria floridensis FSL S10-1187]|uniref:Diguanylate cyclase domain-containing protein n=1 Tax=Listeria floridensis FSL S10-1187 TaxID=1265817 RepID=A0ABN0RE31_9LIST|nr:GGDEF domain-containing protein [Listeria floridensis]EUJ30651.1 diguanylate cyclase domain-containing protein [Listeria floridensis FSL S10-1187]
MILIDFFDFLRTLSFGFANISVLVFGYFLLARVTQFQFNRQPDFQIKFMAVLFSAIFGFFLMNISLSAGGYRIVDLEWIFIILNFFYFGAPTAFFTSLIIGVERFLANDPEIATTYLLMYLGTAIIQLIVMPLVKRYNSELVRLLIIFAATYIPLVFASVLIIPSTTNSILFEIVIYSVLGAFTCYYIVTDLTKIGKRFNFFEQTSKFDFLTKIGNRYSYDLRIEQLCKQNRFYLFLLDIDHFKLINDQYGHDIGDLALKLFAEKLTRMYPDSVYRLGGDEFAIVLDYSSPFNIEAAKRTIKNEIKTIAIDLPNNETLSLSTSVGAAQAFPGISANELYRMVDQKLYEDKKTKI